MRCIHLYTMYSHQSPKSIGHAPVMTENGFPAKSNLFLFHLPHKYILYIYICNSIYTRVYYIYIQDQSLRSAVNNGMRKPEHVNFTAGPGELLRIFTYICPHIL